mmetsp:Transcript_34932/g.79753  ORF Transcript_34932/g.79753 Transcript_34932/m.79753 type:complete len:218 (+) Transcript_34932:76-729(+)
MVLNFFFRQAPELAILASYRGDFDLAAPEVASQHTSQTYDGSADRFVKAVFWDIIHPLLEEVCRLLLLRAARRPLERQIVPSRVDLQNLRALHVVDSHDHEDHGQWSHARALRVDLCYVRHPLRQHGGGDGVTVLELKVSRLVPHPLHGRVAVGRHARGEDADLGRHVVHVRDRCGDDEAVRDFPLRDDHGGVLAAQGYARQPRRRGCRLEGVLHLV